MQCLSAFIYDPFFDLAVLVSIGVLAFRITSAIATRLVRLEESVAILDMCKANYDDVSGMRHGIQALHDTAEKHDRMLKHMAKMRAAKAAKRQSREKRFLHPTPIKSRSDLKKAIKAA